MFSKYQAWSYDQPKVKAWPLIRWTHQSVLLRYDQTQSFSNILISGLRRGTQVSVPIVSIVSCLLRMYTTLLKTLYTLVYQNTTTQTVISHKMIGFKTLLCYSEDHSLTLGENYNMCVNVRSVDLSRLSFGQVKIPMPEAWVKTHDITRADTDVVTLCLHLLVGPVHLTWG